MKRLKFNTLIRKARVVRDKRFKGRPYVYLVRVGDETIGRHSNKQNANSQANAYNGVQRKRNRRRLGFE